jgi:tRNA uridine 5-carbamoylmethylation protein Kti12
MRHELWNFASINHGIYNAIYLSTSLTTCLKWNYNRGSPIISQIIQDIASKFNYPGKKYQWDIPYYSFNPENIKMEDAVQNYLNKLRSDLHHSQSYPNNHLINTFLQPKNVGTSEEPCDTQDETKSLISKPFFTNNSNNIQKSHEKPDAEVFDLQSRILIRELIHNQISEEYCMEIRSILQELFHIDFNSSSIAKQLSSIRKKFLKWLLNSNYKAKDFNFENLSVIFIEFLKSYNEL